MILVSHRKPNSVYHAVARMCGGGLSQSFICLLCYQRDQAALSIHLRPSLTLGAPARQSTALHPGKDFAVSPQPFDWIIPEGTLAFRHWRHCSHLYSYLRRALPATLLRPRLRSAASVRTFLPCHY